MTSLVDYPCNGSVIALPVTDVKLPNGSTRRGFELQVGTPPQTISARPAIHFAEGINTHVKIITSTSLNFNNCMEWFKEAGVPKASTSQRCTTFAGGVYRWDLSSTHNDPIASEPGETDVITVGTEKLDNFLFNTIHPNGQSDFNFHFIGMQRESAMLRALYEKKIIGTKSWGYNQGTTGGNPLGLGERADGMFTIGGYDRAHFVGEPVKQSLDTSTKIVCPISIKVKRLVFKDEAGTVDLLGSADPFSACIDPLSEAVQIPPAAFTRLETHKNKRFRTKTSRTGNPIYFDKAIVDTGPSFFSGNLTIVLDNGFETTIPNSELLKPYTNILDTGIEITNTTAKVITLTDYTTLQDALPKFGIPFLAAAYMYINYDDNTMFLAKPKHIFQSADKSSTSDPTSLPMPIRPPECTAAAKNGNGPTTDHGGVSPGSTSGSKLSSGAIAGIAIGGVAVVVISWLVWYFGFHRRRRRNAATMDSEKPYHGMLLEAHSREIMPSRVELGHASEKAELASSSEGVSTAELVAISEYYELDSGDRGAVEKSVTKA